MLRRVVVILCALALSVSCTTTARRPLLILVSLDGWRADYSLRVPTPNLDALASRGVRAEWLTPVFPTKTFPNHYTIVTGLYPEHHGIVSNVMEDPAIGARFTLSAKTALDPRWWSGEPVWNTAERQQLRTAAMFWPGSEVPIGGHQPTDWLPYKESMPNGDRVKKVLDWLSRPESERPSFITLYFSDVDTAGHRYGPTSPQVATAIRQLDQQIGDLVAGIDRLGLTPEVTVAVVSDHGMTTVDRSHVIFADDYIDLSTVDVVEWSPLFTLRSRSGDDAAVYAALEGRHPALRVYRRETTPEQWHYRTHPRIPPVVAVADEGWTVTSHARFERNSAEATGGEHGFDPERPSMRALFVAAGPGLRKGAVVPPFENIHLYDFFCRVLGIDPAPNDGDPAATSQLFE